MPDQLIDRMAWCLRNYKNAAKQGRVVSTDVEATAEQALKEYDNPLIQTLRPLHTPKDTP